MEQQQPLTYLTVDSVSSKELREIAKWGRFLSILGFIMCALVVLLGFFAGSLLATFGGVYDHSSIPVSHMSSGIIAFIYIIFALIYFFPVLFLYQSSTKMKLALNSTDQQIFNEALTKLKAMFRYVGVLTIIVLAIYAVVILIAIIAVAAMH